MIVCPYSLRPPITVRTELHHDGSSVRKHRQSSNMPPGPPVTSPAAAYMYVCPVTKHYVVAARADTCKGSDRRLYVCYQTFRRRDAAVMYAMMTRV